MAAVVDDTPLLLSNHSGHEDEKEVGFVNKFRVESKKLWKIAGPAIFTALCQYSLGALTQTFTGFVGEIELAAVSVENSVIAGLAFGVMVSKYNNFHLVLASLHSSICGSSCKLVAFVVRFLQVTVTLFND